MNDSAQPANDTGARMRAMQTEDLATILGIERNAQISPWSRLSFEESLTHDYICRVLCIDDVIVAYHICSSVLDELHLLNLVVTPLMQGRGLAHRLMHDIVDLALDRQLSKIFLEVRASNTVAQSLYQQWQFKQIGIRKQYYAANDATTSRREDALVLARLLANAAN